jgi:hypothetical protein
MYIALCCAFCFQHYRSISLPSSVHISSRYILLLHVHRKCTLRNAQLTFLNLSLIDLETRTITPYRPTHPSYQHVHPITPPKSFPHYQSQSSSLPPLTQTSTQIKPHTSNSPPSPYSTPLPRPSPNPPPQSLHQKANKQSQALPPHRHNTLSASEHRKPRLRFYTDLHRPALHPRFARSARHTRNTAHYTASRVRMRELGERSRRRRGCGVL